MKTNSAKSYWNLGNRQIFGRLIVPTARERIGHETKSLSPDLAANIIFASGTQFLILGTSTTCGMGSEVESKGGVPFYDVYKCVQQLLTNVAEKRTFYTLINTSRSTSAQEAVDRASLGYEMLQYDPTFASTMIKLEVFDPKTHAPVDTEVLRAAQDLHKSNPNLEILPFITKDPNLATDLVHQCACPAIRIFGTTIGRYQGLGDEDLFTRVVNKISVPIIAEGGLSSAEHVKRALELGASACLVNTAIAEHKNPLDLVNQLREATEA